MSERDYDALEAAEHREWQMDKLQDELIRLRAIERAAREVTVASYGKHEMSGIGRELHGKIEALRLALGGVVSGSSGKEG